MKNSKKFLKTAIIYVRSCDRETFHSPSIEDQERICREFALRRGYRIIEVFRDKNESALTFERPLLQALIRICCPNKNKIKVVVVFSRDRLSTRFYGFSKLKSFFRRNGIKLILVVDLIAKHPVKQAKRPL